MIVRLPIAVRRIGTTAAMALWQLTLATSAYCADWSIKSQASQGFEVNDNRSLEPQSPGTTVESISRVTVDAVKVLPRFRFGAGGDLSYRALGGPGADDSTNPMDNGLWYKAETFDKLTKYHLLGSWRHQDAVSAQIEDSGLNTVRGDISTYVLDGGLIRQMTAVDALSWSTQGKFVDISSSSGAPFLDVSLTTTWTRRQTATTDLLHSLQFELLAADDASNTQTEFVRATTGLQTHLMKRLTFRSSVGASWVTTDRDNSGLVPGPVSGITLASASDFGGLLDAELIWRPLDGTKAALFATHNLAPNTVGEIEKRTRLGIGVTHTINHSSFVSVSGELSRQDYLDRILDSGSTDVLRATATYGYQWTPEWQTRIAYKFAHREDDRGVADSNAVFLSVLRNINLAGR